jgi:hypothetical protein
MTPRQALDRIGELVGGVVEEEVDGDPTSTLFEAG